MAAANGDSGNESDNEINNVGFFATVHYGKKIVTKRLLIYISIVVILLS